MKYFYVALLPVAIFLMLKTTDEPIIRILKETPIQSLFSQFSNGNSIIFNISVGYVVSFVFWLMNIHIPKVVSKREQKMELEKDYIKFKKSIIRILLQAVATSDYDMEFSDPNGLLGELIPEEVLIDSQEFRNFFYQNNSQNWRAVLNGLNENHNYINDLYIEFELFERSLDKYINQHGNNNVKDYRLFADFVYRLKHSSNAVRPEDPSKYIGDFLLEIFDDKLNYDLIQRVTS